jgi:hypothetical protein
MKKLLWLLAWPMLAANTVSLTAGATTVAPGATVTVVASYSGTAVNGLQWNLVWPSTVTAMAVAGQAANNASKTLYCNSTASKCLIAGLNQNVLTGNVGRFTVKMPTVAGTYTFVPSNPLGSSTTGTPVAVSPGPSISIKVR